jgi:hypothetical protein
MGLRLTQTGIDEAMIERGAQAMQALYPRSLTHIDDGLRADIKAVLEAALEVTDD